MARQSAKSAKSSSANPSAKRPSAKRMRLDRAFESRDKQVYRNKRRRAAYKKHANTHRQNTGWSQASKLELLAEKLDAGAINHSGGKITMCSI